MIWARIAAVLVVLGAVGWIGSGYLERSRTRAETAERPPAAAPVRPLFKVVVQPADLVPHARRFDVSGRTLADKRVMATTRTSGIVTKLAVERGDRVKQGEVLAELSDEAREAQVAQARARLTQRRAELEARERLARQGNFPALQLENLRAELAAAEALLAAAAAELERGTVIAPMDGIVNEVPAELGQALMIGGQVAEIVALDPVLAVGEVPERRLGGISVGDKAQVRLATGQELEGVVRFIARRASAQTRTYRVDVALPNKDGRLVDGIAAEIRLTLAPVPATRVPRSALVFSSEGKLGLRIVDAEDVVRFAPVTLVDDQDQELWVSGLEAGARIIVRGQDFIAEGQKVEPVAAATAAAEPAR